MIYGNEYWNKNAEWPQPGEWHVFLGKNGYDDQLERALRTFFPGQLLLARRCNVGNWSSSVEFYGYPGSYNTVMFDKYVDSEGKPFVYEGVYK